ncbi:hypothetical protein V6N12_076056 [Hibiscus sabdariffa]|uniref:Uncharacterized protein n=1 Tax=Hibiscus sabdariffa TaxID=183260 RepID=A0ABR2AY45_9ROSI
MLSIDFIYAHDPVKNRILVRVAKLTLIKGRTFRGLRPLRFGHIYHLSCRTVIIALRSKLNFYQTGHGAIKKVCHSSGDGIGTFLCFLVSRREGSNLLFLVPMLTTLGKVSCSLDMGSKDPSLAGIPTL